MASFKVLGTDWRDKIQLEHCFCPICRFDAPKTNNWSTPEQVAEVHSRIKRAMHEQLGNILKKSSEKFNRTQPKKGLISVSMSYKPGSKPVIMSAAATAAMQLKSVCENCQCRYTSIGAAFFCPACGHNSATSIFESCLANVCGTLAVLAELEQTITLAATIDQAKDSVRDILEGSMGRLVSSFQRFAEARYDGLATRASLANPGKNAFQNLDRSNALWKQAIQSDYQSMLSLSETSDLRRLFQQRLLLEHTEGIVDQEYIDKSGDSRFAVGQRLVIQEDTVLRLAELISKLASELRRRT